MIARDYMRASFFFFFFFFFESENIRGVNCFDFVRNTNVFYHKQHNDNLTLVLDAVTRCDA